MAKRYTLTKKEEILRILKDDLRSYPAREISLSEYLSDLAYRFCFPREDFEKQLPVFLDEGIIDIDNSKKTIISHVAEQRLKLEIELREKKEQEKIEEEAKKEAEKILENI